jgi:GT2 family glycosyltransferase
MTYQPKTLETAPREMRPVLDDIAIVIPTVGRAILEESLYWIVNGSAWPGKLIVVDQGLNDHVAALLERIRTLGIEGQYIPSEQCGRAAGINCGLEQVQTRFVAITDDDCFVETEWLTRMVKQLRSYPEAIVTGRVETAGGNALVVVTSHKPAIYRRPSLRFDRMSGGNMGTSMSVFRRVGLFDEHSSLRTAEDGEWSYRALRAGVPIIYAPEVGVRHWGWRNQGERGLQYKDYARSHGGFYGKYLRQGDLFIALRVIVHHFRALRRWVRGTITGDREAASYGRAYLAGLLPGILAGCRRGSSLKACP